MNTQNFQTHAVKEPLTVDGKLVGTILETDLWKGVDATHYHYHFNKKTGFFARWGQTRDDDPTFSFVGPELLDLEVSTICNGIGGKPCPWCYKSNTGKGENMSFETFKKIFDKMPRSLTQIAFGIGSLDAIEPDIWKMFDYCRTNGYNYVVPNVTINGDSLTDEQAKKLVKYCGAVAVSCYEPKDICYEAVHRLTTLGLKQVNIHQLLADETYDKCLQTLQDMKDDPRIAKLNAVVFLHLKPKGKRNTLNVLRDSVRYKKLVNFALDNELRFGFDSCGAPHFLQAVEDHKQYEMFQTLAEPCESGLFSSYINTEGKYFPCSFMEGEEGYTKGLDVLECNTFLDDIWFHPEVVDWRQTLTNNCDERGCRKCPHFNIY